MNTKNSKIITGIVIVLIILVVLFFYVMLHVDSNGSSSGLGQYLKGLMGDTSMSTSTMEMGTSTSGTQTAPAATSGGKGVPTGKPFITKLSPVSGTTGQTVFVIGGNFDPAVNYVTFGPADGDHTINGLPDNVVASSPSPDGKTVKFNVPLDAPSQLQCDSTGKNCVNVQAKVLPAGQYAVTVKTNTGVTNTVYFTLVH